MKKIITTIFILTLLLIPDSNSLKGNNFNFNISNFKLNKTISGYDILFNINHSGIKKEFFDDSRVVLSSEKYKISGPIENGIVEEKDFLYSRIPFDIDGDGKFESKIKLEEKNSYVFITGKKINQVQSRKNFDDFLISDYLENNTIKSFKLNEAAPFFILYDYDSKTNFITFGIGDRQNPILAEFFPNPCVEIIVARETDSISKIPSCSISGQSTRTRLSNEIVFSAQEWLVAETLAEIPFQPGKSGKEQMKISLSNLEKPFAVILSIKFSLKEGTTLSTKKLINIID